MAFTRFHDDPCRIEKQLQQSTDPGRWVLNVPGNGSKPSYMADPQIRIQTWGANLMTDAIQIDSELRGYNRPISRDCLGKDEYTKRYIGSQTVNYPTNESMYVSESRTIMPAWTARDLEQTHWAILPLNPQENTCLSFQNNISTRILEKDYFVPKVPCINNENMMPLPTAFDNRKGNSSCTSTNSCKMIR